MTNAFEYKHAQVCSRDLTNWTYGESVPDSATNEYLTPPVAADRKLTHLRVLC